MIIVDVVIVILLKGVSKYFDGRGEDKILLENYTVLL